MTIFGTSYSCHVSNAALRMNFPEGASSSECSLLAVLRTATSAVLEVIFS